MLGFNPWTLIAAGVAGIAIFAAGINVGDKMASAGHKQEIINELKAASDAMDVKQADLDEAYAQIEYFNLTTAEQEAQINALLMKDREAREIAQEAAAMRARDAKAQRDAIRDVLQELQLQIANNAYGGCAAEPVDSGLLRDLNAALAEGDNN